MKKSDWVGWAILFFYSTFVLLAGKMSGSYESCLMIYHDAHLMRFFSSMILFLLAIIILVVGSKLYVKVKEKETKRNL